MRDEPPVVPVGGFAHAPFGALADVFARVFAEHGSGAAFAHVAAWN